MTHQIILSLSHLSLSNNTTTKKKSHFWERKSVCGTSTAEQSKQKITMKIECEIFCAYKVYNISYTCEAKMCTEDNIDV